MASPDVIQTAAEAGAWLEGLINYERLPDLSEARLDLAPIEALMERLGHPERQLSVFHVAGSKGKGSLCLLTESILSALGEKVGTFTSPHLERWTERFRIGGREIGEADLASATEVVRPHVEALRSIADGPSPTFFDATTAVAFVLFSRAKVDRAVIEVGLGGRLDSTNVLKPAVTAVTQIELEHTDKLGSRVEEIAFEKAGILKSGVPCVTGALVEPAQRVVEERAREIGVEVARLGRDFFLELSSAPEAEPGPFGFRESAFELDELSMPILGRHQLDNAALAIAAVRRLTNYPAERLAEAVRSGLASVRLPGRVEVVSERPRVILDAAHTEASVRSLVEVLAAQRVDRRCLVLSISRDKAVASIVKLLAPVTDEIWLTRADATRSTDLETLDALVAPLMPGIPRHCVENAEQAASEAFSTLGPRDLLCCAGSVYLAGACRGILAGPGSPEASSSM